MAERYTDNVSLMIRFIDTRLRAASSTRSRCRPGVVRTWNVPEQVRSAIASGGECPSSHDSDGDSATVPTSPRTTHPAHTQ